jgi:PPOX class probable F420-dependent enzyme
MSFVMSAEEREQFLAGLHVGVLSVAAGDDRGPLAVPVWYDYRAGGQVSVITGRGTRKGRAIRAAGRMSLCAQDESPPYRYVSVEGPVVIEELDPGERLAMARRYLGTEGGDQYVVSNPDPDREMEMLRMRPERWVSVDYGKQPG